MKVRIRLGAGPRVKTTPGKNRHVALATAALLTPSSLVACTFAFWRLAADLSWTGSFAISQGVFSHWQAWLAAAVSMQAVSMLLNRYGAPALGRSYAPAELANPKSEQV